MVGNGRVVYITLVLMALLRTTVLQNLSLNVKEEEIKMADENFLVVCTLHNASSENIVLKWYNPNNVLIVESEFPRVKIRPNPGNSKLILKDLKTSDAGVYSCKATVNGKLLEASTKLKIYRPLSFHNCEKQQQPIIYKNAKIRCTASGDPSPKVRWAFKGKTIKTKGRYEVTSDGLEIKNITEADNGEYILEAEIIKKSAYDDRSIFVKVVVPPKISQPPEISKPVEGSELVLGCKAKGDPNPRYRWFKDSIELTGSGTEIDNIDGRLKVKDVKKSDGGKYKCVAWNIGGNDSATAEVTVLVPPSVEVPKEKTGKEGKEISIVCKGKGIPVPSLTWQKSNDAPFPIGKEMNGVLVQETKSKPDKELTLTISSLKASDADNYTCIGDNEAGNDAKRTYLIVQYKPVFVNTPVVAYNWMGNKANITCTAKSLPKSAITWQAHGQEIGNTDTYKVFKSEGQEQMTSYLQVSVTPNNEKTVFTDYKCKAVNIISQEEIKITLKKAVVPKLPSKVNVLSTTPTTVTMLINPPENDGGIPVNQYHIVYVTGSETKNHDVPVTEKSDSPKKVELEQLIPHSKYHIKVFAGNKVGLSTTSVDFSTETPSIRAPFDVFIKSSRFGNSPTSYRVAWSQPRTGGADIESYSVQYRMVHIVKDQNPWVVDDTSNNGEYLTQTVRGKTSTVIENLKDKSYYQIQVTANNKVGSSNPRPVIILTKEHPSPVDTASKPKTNIYKATSKENIVNPDQTKELLVAKDVPTAAATAGISSGGVAGLIIAFILIIIIILDLICYFKFKKGVTMILVSSICKKGSSAKDKSADVEAGASQETTLLTDKQQKEEVEQAGEENKEAATEEGVTDEKKPLKNEDTDDDLKKDQTDKIDTEDKKCEEIMSKES